MGQFLHSNEKSSNFRAHSKRCIICTAISRLFPLFFGCRSLVVLPFIIGIACTIVSKFTMTEISKGANNKTNNNNKKRRRGRKDEGTVPHLGGGGGAESVDTYQAHKTLLIQLDEDAPTWYDYGKNLPGRNDTTVTDPPQPTDQPNHKFIAKCRSIGDMIFQREIQLVGRGSSADERWVENTMRKGTLKDRIAAMSVTVSSDPVHKFYALDGLLSMVGCSESGGKTNSRVAQLTAEALDDLFLNSFLPPDRKLLSLAQRPLYRYEAGKNGKKSKKTLSPRILLLWRFEEMVKEKYELYLRKYMSQTLQEGGDMQKISILQSAGNLLSSVPEGENLLLNMMVNKLGDPGKKTASAAGHQLRVVLQKHPNMQLIVAREVQQLAHRPHLSPSALYNCIVFLNQLKLTKEDDDDMEESFKALQSEALPASLIKTYFRLFEVAVKIKKDKNPESEGAHMKSRLLSALLTGVNRAHPYLPEKSKDMDEHVDALYRVVHTAAPTACTQALMLLFNLAVGSKVDDEGEDDGAQDEKKDDPSSAAHARKDRFYRALYATLSKSELVSNGKHLTMYFNLLYKAMKFDTDANRINAFAKRLMCTVLHCNPPPMAGSIFLLNEIAKTHESLRVCMEEPPTETDNLIALDESKRDPRSALVIKGGEDDGNPAESSKKTMYPPSWELSLVAHHFHPSVAKFAGSVGEIEYAGDPLKDFGLAPFLDKFAYRNPKSQNKITGHFKRGESIAERRSGTDGLMKARLELPMNDPEFLHRENVNEQDEFFHRYFSERARRDEIKGITRGSNQDIGEDEEDLEEAEEGALDAAEEAEGLDTGKNFEEYERGWESDPEEEAFVDSLALKLLEDAADGPADMDDEDPDMDDSGDMYSDNDDKQDDDKVDDDDEEEEESDGDEDGKNVGLKDEDDFMDADDSDDSDASGDLENEGDLSEDEDAAHDALQHSDEANISSSDDENDLVLVNEDDDDDEDEDEEEDSEEEPKSKSRKKARKMDSLPTFADADEYAEMINNDFAKMAKGGSAGKKPTKQSSGKKQRRK